MFNVEKHSDALKDVIWSRAVQYGTGEIVNMFNDALKLMEKVEEKLQSCLLSNSFYLDS